MNTIRRLIRERVSLGALLRLAPSPRLWSRLPRFLAQLQRYRQMEEATMGVRLPLRLYPCLEDETKAQPATSYYFYQDCWAAKQVFGERPSSVVDIGSTVLLVGILSQFTPCTSVDIRPIESLLDGLTTVEGSVLDLPFADASVPCVTTMCVLEHIGLGRYGDPLSPTGTGDAAREIARVIQPGGVVVYSVPIASQAVLEFNANRRFTYKVALGLFPDWIVVDSCLLRPEPVEVSDLALRDAIDPIACFCLRKPR